VEIVRQSICLTLRILKLVMRIVRVDRILWLLIT
jgi:hypothetical protein